MGGAFLGLGAMGATDSILMLNGAVWAPLALLFSMRAAGGKDRFRSAAGAGAAVGMAWLSGCVQLALFLSITLVVLWIWLITVRGPPSAHASHLLRDIRNRCRRALQLLPWLEYRRALAGSIPQAGDFVLIFAGFTGIALTALALLFARREPGIRPAALFSLCGLGLAFADPVPALLIFYSGISVLIACGIDYLSYSEMSFGNRVPAVLAALGALVLTADLVLTRLSRGSVDERITAAGIVAIAAGGVLMLRTRRFLAARAGTYALAALLLCDIGLSAGQRFQLAAHPMLWFQQSPEVKHFLEYLRYVPGPWRLSVDTVAVPYNLGDLYGVDAFDGQPPATANALRAGPNAEAQERYGIRYYIGAKPSNQFQKEVFRRETLGLYTNPEATPRVRVYRARPCPAGDQVEILRRTQNNLEVFASLGCPGTVVVAETWFPGWRARVDGVRTPVRQVFGSLRGVDAGPGGHRIHMQYAPRSVYLGAAMTGAALLTGCVLWIVPLFRRGRRGT